MADSESGLSSTKHSPEQASQQLSHERPVISPAVGPVHPPATSSSLKSDEINGAGEVPQTQGEGRRRVRSLDTTYIPSDPSFAKRSSMANHYSRRSRRVASGYAAQPAINFDPLLADFEPQAFSDEYDLSQQDPRILQDVQRALQFQNRRRNRQSAASAVPALNEVSSRSDMASTSSVPAASSSTAVSIPSSPAKRLFAGANISSEIDFSPSIGTSLLHPIPSSSDGGATLDWTGSQSEDEKLEKRWGLSINKRKGKEKTPISTKAAVEKQEALYTDKLARIRAEARPHTIRKAAIVSEQLQRRYNVIFNSLSTEVPFRLTNVVRWYANSDSALQATLDSSEPLTWLKHLLQKGGKKRSLWYTSALIMEEYTQSRRKSSGMQSIPENSVVTSTSSSIQMSPAPTSSQPASSALNSDPPSHHFLGASLTRKRSLELSFEPHVDSARSSWDGHYRRRGESISKVWRTPLVERANSPQGSVYSSILSGTSSHFHGQHAAAGGLSPTSSRLQMLQRIGHLPNESDDMSSSPHNSQSDQSRSEDGLAPKRKKVRRSKPPRPAHSNLQSPRESETELDRTMLSSTVDDSRSAVDVSTSEVTLPAHQPSAVELTVPSGIEALASDAAATPRAILRHRVIRRTSLSSDRSVTREVRRQQLEVDEEKERYEYQVKAQLLNESIAQNHRLRQRLQRVATDVRDYEALRSNLMKTLGVSHRSLPSELLESFHHDPSSVTGGTRQLQGWRAVEDIHGRILRQLKTFQIFLSIAEEDGLPVPPSVLDDQIDQLMGMLENLKTNEEAINDKVQEVTDALNRVKSIHITVKKEYNEAMSHTSIIYPELSQIVVLEESYKDHYQQFWEFGMDALTFVFDTVAPFWRTYGRIIGDDVQDFLIIPWYRNEFTGEAKRYPIKALPRRSFRHWMGLFLVFSISFSVTFLQVRAAITSTLYYRLSWITNTGLRWVVLPCFWVGIFIQWCAVGIESSVVLMQLAVITWWIGWSTRLLH